jgi:hypothetical protein
MEQCLGDIGANSIKSRQWHHIVRTSAASLVTHRGFGS